jgi:hypothetical protein
VLCQRAERVFAARRREPASRPEQRADEPPVSGDRQHKYASRHRALRHGSVRYPVIWHCRRTDFSTLPNLPPQQPIDHQVQISGEIQLARTPSYRVRAQHKKATARKRLEIAARQLTKPTLHPVSRHGGPDRPADHKSYPDRLVRRTRVH